MTLLDRVQAVEDTYHRDDVERSALGLEALRVDLSELVPLERMALIVDESPERARNEIRAACRRLGTRQPWSELSSSVFKELVEQLIALVFGLGPLDKLVQDDSITEIMVNGTRSVFIEREGHLQLTDIQFESDEQVRTLIDRILGPLGRRIDESSPTVSARLPQGHRVHAIIPPLAIDGPHLTIRSFSRRLLTLEELRRKNSFDATVEQFLVWAVQTRKSLAVSGGTGSGKTTLLNALSCFISHHERVITIEDAAELKFDEHPHVVRLEARARNAEGVGEVTIRELVVNALRMRPDRIIVGECRSDEAIDMLQAMNTGHDGSLTTLHANSPREAVDRLVTMVRFGVDLPLDAIEAQIGNAFDLVVQTARRPNGERCVTDIAAMGFDFEKRRCILTALYRRDAGMNEGGWISAPCWLDDVTMLGVAKREEVEAWLQSTGLASSV